MFALHIAVLCPTGHCASSVKLCPSVAPISPCPAATSVRCYDGSCRSSPLECIVWAMKLKGINSATPRVANHSTVLCNATTEALCWNGACVAFAESCPILPPCEGDKGQRCADGSCTNGTCSSEGACFSGYTRCADGSCRLSCLQADGCPIGEYMCPNTVCVTAVADWIACKAAARNATSSSVRVSSVSNKFQLQAVSNYRLPRGVADCVSGCRYAWFPLASHCIPLPHVCSKI